MYGSNNWFPKVLIKLSNFVKENPLTWSSEIDTIIKWTFAKSKILG